MPGTAGNTSLTVLHRYGHTWGEWRKASAWDGEEEHSLAEEGPVTAVRGWWDSSDGYIRRITVTTPGHTATAGYNADIGWLSSSPDISGVVLTHLSGRKPENKYERNNWMCFHWQVQVRCAVLVCKY